MNRGDLGERFPTSFSLLLTKFGFDTAENEPRQVCGSGRAREGTLIVDIRTLKQGCADPSTRFVFLPSRGGYQLWSGNDNF